MTYSYWSLMLILQKNYGLLKAQMMVIIVSNKVIFKLTCAFLRPNTIAYLVTAVSYKHNFIYNRKPKMSCDSLYCGGLELHQHSLWFIPLFSVCSCIGIFTIAISLCLYVFTVYSTRWSLTATRTTRTVFVKFTPHPCYLALFLANITHLKMFGA